MNIVNELKERGFVEQISDEELPELLGKETFTCYAGFDPSSSSLHVGNLLVIMALSHFQRAGHQPIALIGGATGMIGDPSGKSSERNLLSEEEVLANAESIKRQLSRFLNAGSRPAVFLNNADWLVPIRFVHFLRDIGKHFRLGDMLAKDSVRNRMEREEGISFTEFSYMLMQAYDFLHLFDTRGCALQIGGNDQWGNITAGIELIRRLRSKSAYGLTIPLMTTASGQKLGKTEEGAVWLDRERTSPFQFYQYWVRTDDRDALKYLKLFTYLPAREIMEYHDLLLKCPEKREAQKRLAREVTILVHSEEDALKAEKASEFLYGAEISGLSDRELEEIFTDVPSTTKASDTLAEGIRLVELLVETGLAASRGAARKLLSAGGIYLNNRREDSPERVVHRDDLASERSMILRSGKKNYHLVRFE